MDWLLWRCCKKLWTFEFSHQFVQMIFCWEKLSNLSKKIYSDEEQRFVYRIDQSHLAIFCTVIIWPGGPLSPVRIIAQVQRFVYQNQLEPSGSIYHRYKSNRLLWLRVNESNCFELPSDWLLTYWESQSKGSSKQLLYKAGIWGSRYCTS